VNNLRVGIIITSKELGRQPAKNGQKPSSETSFSVSTMRTTECWKTERKKER
jgi:hypothetical protein